ncbi:chemotaxis protein CheW [Zooshikella harenae]|uniref:Purine-binding chemotaxis protein CheW n=1 Tax=Zooshikella harenae TaxID=2827238 RepID=A0ABS5ZIS5_9GAMM|nr:chemotaxis protein CheW [Zooshikella harenae]MBU2713879.1 purine-binding chemotaxis protein CheW [Zooshikella harenae]
MDKQYLCFKLNNELFVHQVSTVREVMPYIEPTPVPGSPDIIEGVLNVRGNVVSIISARRLFKLPENQPTKDSCIIIFDTISNQYGISVDSVDEIVTLNPSEMNVSSAEEELSESQFIKGTVKHAKGLLILVDLSNLIEIERNTLSTD